MTRPVLRPVCLPRCRSITGAVNDDYCDWCRREQSLLDAERRRVAREDRLRALGFEEPTAERRKENLALNIAALREWSKDEPPSEVRDELVRAEKAKGDV